MSSPEENVVNEPAREEPTSQFLIRRIYVKDVSFEAPGSPGTFPQGLWNPVTDLIIDNTTTKLEEELYEVSLIATVTVIVEGQVAYLVEVSQCGTFYLSGLSNDEVKEVLNIQCLTILFPFLRETVNHLAVKGGYPHLLLAPINFHARYHEHLDEQSN